MGMSSQSHYICRSPAGRHFYGTENEIWAGFWAGRQYWKKSFWPIMSNFWGWFFHVFMDKNKVWNVFKNILASTLKSCIKWRWENPPNNSLKSSYTFYIPRLNNHNQLCIALLEMPPCATSIIMTLPAA